jgi:hypothetical protein
VVVRGWAEPYHIGFWIQISAADFSDFQKHGRVNHPSYLGRVANQSDHLGPTLGLPGRMEFIGAGTRPHIALTDGKSPLALAQAKGVDASVIYQWMSETFHDGEPAPLGKPVASTLEKEGWRIVDPHEVGRVPHPLSTQPKKGDTVKVVVQFKASDEKGDSTPLTAGWWIKLDDVGPLDLWSGTLANHPRVPTVISLGSRMWVRPEQVIAYAPQKTE